MASAKRCGFLLGALLAVGAIGVAGFSSGDLVFLKSSATEPFELQLVAYSPAGAYQGGIDLSPATPAGSTLQGIQGLSISPDGRFAFSYGVYSTSTNQKLIVTDISSATKQVVFSDFFALPAGCQLDTNSDPPLAVGPGSTRSSYTVFAILFCGSSISQYLAQLSYNATAAKLTYVKRTHVSPVTYGPQHTPKTEISQLFFLNGALHANGVGTSVHLRKVLRFPLTVGQFMVAYSAMYDQCEVTLSSARRAYAICFEASAGFESEVKVITAGRPSKVIRPIHSGMEFVGLATLPNSPYVYGIHVDEIANEGQGNPDTIEVISKTTGKAVHTFFVERVWTAAWPAVVP